jgi:class 3 adenylate cyclase
MRCSSCGSDHPEGGKFCIECGSPLTNWSPRCGAENLPRAKFCGECGTSLSGRTTTPASTPPTRQSGQAAPVGVDTQAINPIAYTPRHLAEQQALEARGAPDGERKTITALFADIKGSMDLLEDLDPEEARRLIDPALRLMMDAVHRYEGYVAQSLGDGIFALFGAPIAHEDHAQRSLYAALRMQEAIKQYADMLLRERGLNLEIRVGVNTGEVVVRSIRTDDLHTDYVPIGTRPVWPPGCKAWPAGVRLWRARPPRS